ncbi:MAG: phosphoribosylglycinamide formyltransferase [Caulobacterales bacterium]
MLNLGFLASNNGSSLRAIVAAIEAGTLEATACIVVSNRRDAPALAFADEHGIPAFFIPTRADPESADATLALALETAGAKLVILSGYLRKLGPRTLSAYGRRILNIHPALLPRFGGEGMYGRRVHQAVAAAGVTLTGVTVHLVDDEYDHGQVVAQMELPLTPGDDAAAIERKVTAAEPGFFVTVLQRLAKGELMLPTPRP